jgi:hypothetical protein
LQTLAETTTAAVQSPIWLYAAIGLITAGVTIIIAILASFVMRSRAGQPPLADLPASASPSAAPTGTVQEAERLLRLMGEAEEQAARLGQDLRERADRLEALIQAADQRLSALAAAPRATTSHPLPPTGHQAPPAPPAPPAQTPMPPARVVTRPVEVPPAPVFVAGPDPSVPQSSAAARAALDAQSLRDQLLAIEARLNAVPGMSAAAASTPQPLTRPHAPPAPAVTSAPAHPTPHPSQQPASQPTLRAVSVEGSSETVAQTIYRLADQGLSAAQIAQHLGQQTGTVELFLALRQA